MAVIDEIARDVFRISIHVPAFDLQFNHFLVRDEEPLLFHAGMRQMFPALWEAVGQLIDPASLRWISWSHFEVDECGALNEWLARAPNAQAACGQVGAMVNITDFADRPPLALAPRRHALDRTSSIPLGPHASLAARVGCRHALRGTGPRAVLLGPVSSTRAREAVTRDDVVGRYGDAIAMMQAHPVLMDYVPFTPQTRDRLETLAQLQPRMLAAMHGSAFEGDGAAALRAAGDVMERHLGVQTVNSR